MKINLNGTKGGHSYLEAASLNETNLIILIQVGEARDFLGKDDRILDGFVQKTLESFPAYLSRLTNCAIWIL